MEKYDALTNLSYDMSSTLRIHVTLALILIFTFTRLQDIVTRLQVHAMLLIECTAASASR